MDTVELPSPLATVTDSLEHQANLAADAARGFYKFGKTYVTVFGGGDSDCPTGGATICPYFERVRVAPDGKLSDSSWAYFPVQKKWVSLSTNGLKLNFAGGDTTFDGAVWTDELSDSSLRPVADVDETGPWLYRYGNGDIQYRLNLAADSIAEQVINVAQGTTYPEGAKSVTIHFEQKSGVLYDLSTGGFWDSSSDDGKQYPNVAALRAAHTTKDTPLCLTDVGSDALIYFDSAMHVVGFAESNGICNDKIESTDQVTLVEAGVITLAGRPVIALQIPDDLFSSSASAREKHVLAIVGLDEEGYAANGLAYLPGYTKTISGYYNQAAFKAWLNTMTTDAEAQILP